MKSRKEMTIKKLAEFTQKEFLKVGHNFEKVYQQFEKIDQNFKAMVDILDLMRADLRDIKITLGPLVHIVADLEKSVQVLNKRVGRLEEKASFSK